MPSNNAINMDFIIHSWQFMYMYMYTIVGVPLKTKQHPCYLFVKRIMDIASHLPCCEDIAHMLFHYGSLLDQLRALESSKNVKLIKKISAKVSSQDTVE